MGNVVIKSTGRRRDVSAIDGRSWATGGESPRNTGHPHYRSIDAVYGAIKSSPAPPCKVKFINTSGVTLRVSWIDFQGQRVLYSLLPGDGHCCKLSTCNRHPWIVERETGDAFAVYIGGSAVVSIQGRNDFTVRQSTRNPIPWKQEPTPTGQQDCRKFSSIRSTASPPCIVQFANRSTVPLKLSWLDYQGERMLYATLPPGSMFHQRTFTEHPWVLEDENGAFYAIYIGGSAVVTVNGKNDFTVKHTSSHARSQPVQERGKFTTSMAEVLNGSSSATTCSSSTPAHALGTTHLLPHGAGPSDCVHGCTICCEPLADNVWSLRCGHVFHGACLEASCRLLMECPVCRASVNGASDLRKIYLN